MGKVLCDIACIYFQNQPCLHRTCVLRFRLRIRSMFRTGLKSWREQEEAFAGEKRVQVRSSGRTARKRAGLDFKQCSLKLILWDI